MYVLLLSLIYRFFYFHYLLFQLILNYVEISHKCHSSYLFNFAQPVVNLTFRQRAIMVSLFMAFSLYYYFRWADNPMPILYILIRCREIYKFEVKFDMREKRFVRLSIIRYIYTVFSVWHLQTRSAWYFIVSKYYLNRHVKFFLS